MQLRYATTGLLLLLLTPAVAVQADWFIYQPGPFHGEDTWASNVYHTQGIDNEDLIAGGWGDVYRFLIRFPMLEGVPPNANQALLYFMPYDRSDSSSPVSMDVFRLTSGWYEGAPWNLPLAGSYLGVVGEPTPNSWYGIDITSIYNGWQDGTYPNLGLAFYPTSISNQFNNFRSSDYSANWNFRPLLFIDYTPTVQVPNLKLPLPGGKSWDVSTEIGGFSCKNPQTKDDPDARPASHKGTNYFSIDFPARALVNGQVMSYANVPIYAAGSGEVAIVDSTPKNGNYVVIDHDSDGNLNTGFQTRYLHFKNWPAVVEGQQVTQGQFLGYMGDTGEADGVHLHFGVRYRNSGGTDEEELTFIEVDGRHLANYLTECNSAGQRIAFYGSTNTQ